MEENLLPVEARFLLAKQTDEFKRAFLLGFEISEALQELVEITPSGFWEDEEFLDYDQGPPLGFLNGDQNDFSEEVTIDNIVAELHSLGDGIQELAVSLFALTSNKVEQIEESGVTEQTENVSDLEKELLKKYGEGIKEILVSPENEERFLLMARRHGYKFVGERKLDEFNIYMYFVSVGG